MLGSKIHCPLSSPRYATVRQDPDTQRLYLNIKEPERAHLPRQWWRRIRLSNNYTKALEQVDQELIYWPKFMTHKCKQRLTRLTQVRVRSAKLSREEERLGETVVSRLAPKIRRREQTRERKAEAAAKIERAIERELVERLRSGAYGDRPLNVEENVWRKVLRGLERQGEGVRDKDLDDGIEEEEEGNEYEYEREGAEADVEYVSDVEESDNEDLEDFDDWLGGQSGEESIDEESEEDDEEEEDGSNDEAPSGNKRKRPAQPPPKSSKKTKGPKRGIEYEYVKEPAQRELAI